MMKKSCSNKSNILLFLITTMSLFLSFDGFGDPWRKNNLHEVNMSSWYTNNINNISYFEDLMMKATSFISGDSDDDLIVVSLGIKREDTTTARTLDENEASVQCPPNEKYTSCLRRSPPSSPKPRCGSYDREC